MLSQVLKSLSRRSNCYPVTRSYPFTRNARFFCTSDDTNGFPKKQSAEVSEESMGKHSLGSVDEAVRSLEDVLGKARTGVISIQTHFIRGNTLLGSAGGTGFVISENRVVSNAHVCCKKFGVIVNGDLSWKWIRGTVFGQFYKSLNFFRMEILAVNTFTDSCILEISDDRIHRDNCYIFKLKFDVPALGQPLYSIGNPTFTFSFKSGAFSSLRTYRELIEADSINEKVFPESKSYEEYPYYPDVYEIEGVAAPGMSGSPVFDHRGQVVAITFAGLDRIGQDPGALCWLAVPAAYIQSLIDWKHKNPTRIFVHGGGIEEAAENDNVLDSVYLNEDDEPLEPEKKKRHCLLQGQDVPKSDLPQEFIELQRAYFKDVDEFELPEEEVSESDLDNEEEKKCYSHDEVGEP